MRHIFFFIAMCLDTFPSHRDECTTVPKEWIQQRLNLNHISDAIQTDTDRGGKAEQSKTSYQCYSYT